MDLFVRQPATLAGNLDAQKFQCPVVSRNSAAAPSSIPVFTQGAHSPKAIEYMEEVSPGVIFVKSAQLVGDQVSKSAWWVLLLHSLIGEQVNMF